MVQEVDLGPREQEPEGTDHVDALATEYKENLRNLRNAADVQSHSFRRLQAMLDSGQGRYNPSIPPACNPSRTEASCTARGGENVTPTQF